MSMRDGGVSPQNQTEPGRQCLPGRARVLIAAILASVGASYPRNGVVGGGQNGRRPGPRNARWSARQALVQLNLDVLAGLLADRGPQARADRQLVGAVAERHERAAERVAVD